MNKRKLGVLLLVCVLTGGILAGCGKKDVAPADTSSTSPNSNITIGLVMKTLNNPFFKTMGDGAQKAGKELGVQLDIQTGQEETSIDQQIAIVQSMIDKKESAICIAPGDSKAIIPVLKKAQDAGIPIINVDNKIDEAEAAKEGLKQIPYVGASNEEGGYLAGKYLSEQVGKGANVAIIEGIRGVDNAEGRKNGALKAFKEAGVNVVASETANWKTEEATAVMSKILESHPDIKGVFAANDMMAFGVVQVLDSKNLSSKIKVTGYDALDQSKKYIQDGKMISTVDQKPDSMGYQAVKFADDLINHKSVQMSTMVTLENITK